MQSALRASGIQAKSTVSTPDDPEEQEADKTADRMVSSGCSCQGSATCETCKANLPDIQRKSEGGPAPHASIKAIRGALRTGRPLEAGSRAFFEPRFGRDFSRVRVHDDDAAAGTARGISARAFTTGSDIAFAKGQYAPDTAAGTKLLAHELTHVVQQEARSTAVQRDPDPDAPQEPAGFDAEQALAARITALDLSNPYGKQSDFRLLLMLEAAAASWTTQARFDEFFDEVADAALSADETKDELGIAEPAFQSAAVQTAIDDFPKGAAAAPSLRLLLLLQSAKSQWTDRRDFPKLLDECVKQAATEESTSATFGLTDLSDPQLTDAQEKDLLAQNGPDIASPEAFPETWSRYLGKYLTSGEASNYPHYVQQDADDAWKALVRSGDFLPGDILRHGLPLNFPASLGLQRFRLYNILGFGVIWFGSPFGMLYGDPRSFQTFNERASDYLRKVNLADFTILWIEYARSVVQQVKDGELSVSPAAFFAYKRMRPNGVSLQEAPARVTGTLSPPTGRIDPAAAEQFVTNLAGFTAWTKSISHARDITDLSDKLLSDADSLIGQKSGVERIVLAQDWGHERGFYSEALLREWEDIKEHAVDIAEDVGKGAALFTLAKLGARFVPGLNVVVNAYFLASLALDLLGSLADVVEAENQARNATTAVELQRAAANLATVMSSSARKVAQIVATVAATKVAEYGAGKVAGKISGKTGGPADAPSGGEPSGGGSAPSGPSAKDPWDTTSTPAPSPAAEPTGSPKLEVHQGGGQGDAVPRGQLSSVPTEGPLPSEAAAQPAPAEAEVDVEQAQQQELKAVSGARPGEVVSQSQGTPTEASGGAKGGGSGKVGKPPKTKAAKPTRTSGENRLGGPQDPRYSDLSKKVITKLEGEYPELKKANLSILKRTSGSGGFEERMFTSGNKETFQALLRDGRVVQIDDIGPDGRIIESKMRTDLSELRQRYVDEYMTRNARRELDFESNRHLQENVRSEAEKYAERKIDKIKTEDLEKFEDQLVRQSEFIRENGLPPGEWITDSAEAKMKIQTIIQVRKLDNLTVRYVQR